MFSLLHRRDSGSDRCPRCSRVNVDFVDLGLGMLGCFDCGSVFVRNDYRIRQKFSEQKGNVVFGNCDSVGVCPAAEAYNKIISDVPEIPKKLFEDTVAPPVVFTCGTCGKELKTKLALSGHMRSHK